jgi:hypothetical protein
MSIFLALYLLGIAANIFIFRRNWAKGRRFLFSMLLSSTFAQPAIQPSMSKRRKKKKKKKKPFSENGPKGRQF